MSHSNEALDNYNGDFGQNYLLNKNFFLSSTNNYEIKHSFKH